MTTAVSPTSTAPTVDAQSDRRWLILALVGAAQPMVVLDATIVNIALPSAQKARTSPMPTASGSSPRTRWRSGACCC